MKMNDDQGKNKAQEFDVFKFSHSQFPVII